MFRKFLTELASEFETNYTNIEMIVIYPQKGTYEMEFVKPLQSHERENYQYIRIVGQWRK